MNLFLSAGSGPTLESDPRIPKGKRYRLLSCHGHYIRQAHFTSNALHESGERFELMYDSGAFTAWTKGEEVLLDDLIAVYDTMLERYEQGSDGVWLISLDKIPGKRGVTATPADIAEAVRVSDKNFEVLQRRYGERVLPVFHQNESTERLHEVAAMAPYICVSPRNDLSESSRRRWSAEVHALIPGKRTHGLAATGYDMMSKVPWHSVDSATWVLLAAHGSVFMDLQLRVLNVSDQSVLQKDRNQHYKTIPKSLREAFDEFVLSRNFDLEVIQSQFYDRMMFNRAVLMEVAAALPSPDSIAATVPKEVPLFDL